MQGSLLNAGLAAQIGILMAVVPVRAIAQKPDLVALFRQGPHTGPVEQALIGIEVKNTAKEGAAPEIRRANGFVLRSDGFLLTPNTLYSLTFSGTQQEAESQTITVTLHPGTEQARRLTVRRPRFLNSDLSYVVLKLETIHTPALRTMLPNPLKPGDDVEVVWTPWNETAHQFGMLQRRAAKIGSPTKEGVMLLPGEILFAEPLEGVPVGAVVLGPEGLAVGLISGSSLAATRRGFVSFTVLNRITNCVTPVPIPDAQFAALSKHSEESDTATTPSANPSVAGEESEKPAGEGDSVEMVSVPGGPVTLPGLLQDQQLDMEGATVACVAPFQIDKYEVTNRQYYAFWKSLPENERRAHHDAYYPVSWSNDDPPFPDALAKAPVLGVTLSGAQAYAAWHGERLPTPYEWCLAAFGPKGGTEMPDWAKRYVADRTATAQRIEQLHVDFLRAHPDVLDFDCFLAPDLRGPFVDAQISRQDTRLHGFDFINQPSVPWVASSGPYNIQQQGFSTAAVLKPAALDVTRWSKKTVETATEHLWKDWNDPLYVLPVGSREFDVSPYGAMDMILNADELVAPSPWPPVRGNEYALHVDWTPADQDPRQYPLVLGAYNRVPPLPPLSRLLSRANNTYPHMDQLLAEATYREATKMIGPLLGWELHAVPGRILVWPYNYTTSDVGAAGFDVWFEKPHHFRTEMGHPIPDWELHGPWLGLGTVSFLLPTGFRCVR